MSSSLTSTLTSSRRATQTEHPHIHLVLNKYASVEGICLLAVGSPSWGPPSKAFAHVEGIAQERETQCYGDLLGYTELREALVGRLESFGFDSRGYTMAITVGAQQAFLNLALLLCDEGDEAVMIAPYYFSHKLALQLAGATINTCFFDLETLKPDWDSLELIMQTKRPKTVVLTSPNNPSGLVYSKDDIDRMTQLCKLHGSWLIIDQTYFEFLYNDASHYFPPSSSSGNNVIHVFSLSKAFGIPGWRVGYVMVPNELMENFDKVQDTNPSHAVIISQKFALECLKQDFDEEEGTGKTFVQSKVESLAIIRDALWPILAPLGVIKTEGAFYFLVPVPKYVSEEEAIDILAIQFKILLMPGSVFGCENFLRLSYVNLDHKHADFTNILERIKSGFQFLWDLSVQRQGK
jgi:aspartate/methionine/tyrosine aminotransferase